MIPVRVRRPHPLEGVLMRKFKISVVVVFSVFALLLSSAGAAYTADDLANSLYSGWSSSGGGTYGSWYNVALYWLRTIGSGVSSLNTSLDSVESDVDTIRSDVASVKTNTSNLSTMLTRLTSIDTSLDNIESDINFMETDVDNISSYTSTIKTNSNTIVTLLSRSGTLGSDVRDLDTQFALAFSHIVDTDNNTDQIEGYLDNIDYNVAALKSFFDNPEHRALENATNSAVSAATDMVQSNPGGTTQAQKNQAISGFSSSAAGALDTGVSSDSAWGFLTTGDAAYQPGLLPAGRSGNIFAFFSTETMYDLDPSLATRSPQPEVVDYLSLNQQTFDALKGDGSDHR